MNNFDDLGKDMILGFLQDAALNWLAHDGLWFRAVEDKFGPEAALELDKKAWQSFTIIEAKRIMKRLTMEPGGGIPALVKALRFRLYAHINDQKITELGETSFVFRMTTCRVQEARLRQGLPDFPCKDVGLVEYGLFAKTIDPRIETRCLACPPDPRPAETWCAWKFEIKL
jgi:hypothetical protein